MKINWDIDDLAYGSSPNWLVGKKVTRACFINKAPMNQVWLITENIKPTPKKNIFCCAVNRFGEIKSFNKREDFIKFLNKDRGKVLYEKEMLF